MNSIFSQSTSVYFVGIKGIAMAALAVWAKEAGCSVRGSDVTETFPSDEVLAEKNIEVLSGFSPDHIDAQNRPDLVIYTGAHDGRDNVEVQQAMKLNIPVLPHGKALGEAMRGKRQVSVAGSHGKTTTSAMIATILKSAGRDPSYAVGCGKIFGLGLPGHYGSGDVFVAEADEYITEPGHDATPRFLWQSPEILVVTNIDYDHPDAYPSLQDVQKAFLALQDQMVIHGITVVNVDDPASKVLCNGAPCISYGQSTGVGARIIDVISHEGETHFSLQTNDEGTITGFILRVPGIHNVMNATAAMLAARAVGASWGDAKSGLATFLGTKRRFERVGLWRGATIYDDYAHHPKEISATLAAARLWFPKRRILCIFQPHTYSRTKSLLSDFARAFRDVDIVFLTDIYASAREHETLGITGATLAARAKKHHSHIAFTKDKEGTINALTDTIQKGDIVIFMGAGDIYGWSHELVNYE